MQQVHFSAFFALSIVFHFPASDVGFPKATGLQFKYIFKIESSLKSIIMIQLHDFHILIKFSPEETLLVVWSPASWKPAYHRCWKAQHWFCWLLMTWFRWSGADTAPHNISCKDGYTVENYRCGKGPDKSRGSPWAANKIQAAQGLQEYKVDQESGKETVLNCKWNWAVRLWPTCKAQKSGFSADCSS